MGATVAADAKGLHAAGDGPLHGVDVDLTEMPDPGLTIAALALRAVGRTRIRGVAVHRLHETDRIAAAATELRRLGATVAEHDDGLTIDPPARPVADVLVRTYRDHRMAMAFSLLGDVVVDDPGCVAKTWPTYFAMLDRFGMVRA
jgi:3-phosphoshikimate 1-carboxyvinyltransferase